jgi:hypothetical protein
VPHKERVGCVCRPLVTDLLDGYNCSLLAYGQTGSGKTHTMMGEVRGHLSSGLTSVEALMQPGENPLSRLRRGSLTAVGWPWSLTTVQIILSDLRLFTSRQFYLSILLT